MEPGIVYIYHYLSIIINIPKDTYLPAMKSLENYGSKDLFGLCLVLLSFGFQFLGPCLQHFLCFFAWMGHGKISWKEDVLWNKSGQIIIFQYISLTWIKAIWAWFPLLIMINTALRCFECVWKLSDLNRDIWRRGTLILREFRWTEGI